MPNVSANGLNLEFDEFGSLEAEPLLLISGLGVQMTRWAPSFCKMLAAEGFRVIRFDNRDVGLSTHMGGAATVSLSELAETLSRGDQPSLAYTLRDMANDAIGLLDALSIERAHVVGRSMGGMIAQIIAAEFAPRTLSLVSIMSSTGNAELPPPTPEALVALTRAGPNPFEDEAAYASHCVETARVFAGPGFPFDEDAQRSQVMAEFRRAYNPEGFVRQIGAMITAGDRRSRLRAIVAPTLVVHGSDDPLIPADAGRDTADNIRRSKLLLIEGMGHDLPPELHRRLVQEIAANGRRPELT